MPVGDTVERFRPAGFRWWLSGGHALEAHLGLSWRGHDDTDIAISRADAPRLVEVLDGWDIHIGAGGVLTPWDGGPLDASRSQNNLWCRPGQAAPWMIDVTVGDGNEHEWIYRRDPTIRRPWDDAVLTTPDGTPYLAPELQLLFKANDVRPKDDLDAAIVIPLLEPQRRSWLAIHLPAEHRWQTTIAGTRARLALGADPDGDAEIELHASGQSSQAWRGPHADTDSVVRVPIPNSGRLNSYRSEARITRHLAEAGHPVCTWDLVPVDDVECSIGPFLPGTPVEDDGTWPQPFVDSFAAALRGLHQLPATGWGPLENRADRLHGTSPSATAGIVDRWFHAPIWPFDGSTLDSHPLAILDPELLPTVAALEHAIVDAATEPFGVLHSDLHRQHLLRDGDQFAALLDFGDAFIGSTAWDFALLHWYHGASNAHNVAHVYGSDTDLATRGALLAVAVGCYKMAKTPTDGTLRTRLRALQPARLLTMVHESAADGYRQQSTAYAKARPSYHRALIDRSVEVYGHGTIVDLGAGTGIFTRQLVERGLQPIAVEPVAEMRAALQTSLPAVTALDGTAEDTGLADSSVDTVFVAQAFHWFDHRRALPEIRRILRPGGHLVCVWNVRDETEPWVRHYTDIVDRHAGDTPRHRTMDWRRAIDAEPDFELVEDFAVANPVPSSPDAAVARALSTSFIAALDPDARADVLEHIGDLVGPLGPSFDFPYRSELQAWRHRGTEQPTG